MKTTARYFKVQLKRAWKAFPFVLAVTLLLLASFVLAGKAYINNLTESDSRMHLKIGVVGDMSSKYISLGVLALQNLDTGRFSIEFAAYDEQEAKRALKDKELAAYAVIPDDFIREISHGRIKKIRYCTTATATGVITVLKDEIASEVSSLMIHSQKGIFGATEALTNSGIDEERRDSLSDEVNIRYIEKIIERDKLFDIEEIGLNDSLSTVGSFICGLCIFFLMLWGLSSVPLFAEKCGAIKEILAAKRFPAILQVLCEYAAYLLMMLTTLLIIFSALAATNADLSGLIDGCKARGALWITMIFPKTIPIAAAISALQFCIYEFTKGYIGSVITQFLTVVALSFISGCIYPLGFLPEAVQKLSGFLPSGIARSCLASTLGGVSAGTDCLLLMLYTLIFLAISAAARRASTKRAEAITL